MLSYRHAFHAGNHADVLKHLVEVLTLDYLIGKDKPLCYIDTHAGPGMYDLTQGYAAQNEEFRSGITRLWHAGSLPDALTHYVDCVRSLNLGGNRAGADLALYPGSPAIARALLRDIDRLCLFELHPNDFVLLQRWATGDRRIQVRNDSGFEGLISVLPPREKRALVLIDPPYEVKHDYAAVVTMLRSALKRFATGVYVIWYPLLDRGEVGRMTRELRALPDLRWINAELMVEKPAATGMYGSGVFIVNPPWPLLAQLQQCLPVLATLLNNDHVGNGAAGSNQKLGSGQTPGFSLDSQGL